MSEVRDHFCSNLDHTSLGITARIERFAGLLAAKATHSLRSNSVISESAARGQGLASHLASPAPSRRARACPRPTRLSPPQDPPLAAALDNIRVAPTFYAFRWISLLMTQA